MKIWMKVLAITLLVATPAMMLGPVIWPPAEVGPEPTAAQFPFFLFLADLHIHTGTDMQGPLYIEYGFPVTLMTSAVILTYSLLTTLRSDEAGVNPAGAAPSRAFGKPV